MGNQQVHCKGASDDDDKPAVCPVPHHVRSAAAGAGAAPAKEAKETKSDAPLVCPVPHGERKQTARSHGSEPADTPDRAVASHGGGQHPFLASSAKYRAQKIDKSGKSLPELPAIGERPSEYTIPAAGRGNSEDGKTWVNPSPNQLFRALARRDKPIEPEDAESVAAVHDMVTDQTWKCIMEYEDLHKDTCPKPTLARFQGMYGIHTVKSKFMHLVGGVKALPFDRHDWTVDRCGKEVRYIIDYYAVEEPDPHGAPGETQTAYFIDARPAMTIGGMYDRARMAVKRYNKGESVW